VIQLPRNLQWTAVLVAAAAVCLPLSSLLHTHSGLAAQQAVTPREAGSRTTQSKRYTLRWASSAAEGHAATVQVLGLDRATLKVLQRSSWKLADWQRVLAIYAEQGKAAPDTDLPPMLGSYRVDSGILTFEPQFRLESGLVYRAVFRPGELPGAPRGTDSPITATFELPPKRRVATTVVEHIFPSSPIVPENLLKFYIHFSAPMSRGGIYEHLQLRNEAGKSVELPFLEIDEELWDPTMTRLTLFIDPGRIKRGVLPLEEVGPALETGKSYSLAIDSGWKDGSGNPLKTGFEKRFSVGEPDRNPPDPAQWSIQVPPPGTRTPLIINFPEPMDQALAQRAIQVTGESGGTLIGKVTLEDQERRWIFVPASPWRVGAYQLVIPTNLEDLAGNNIGKPFEVDLFEGVQRRLTTPTVKLPFELH
jgi:hypothetical protein